MAERVEIGKLCEKGHTYYRGKLDYGVCGSHEVATIYVTVEVDRPNSRGTQISAEEVAEELKLIVSNEERLSWKEALDD